MAPQNKTEIPPSTGRENISEQVKKYFKMTDQESERHGETVQEREITTTDRREERSRDIKGGLMATVEAFSNQFF